MLRGVIEGRCSAGKLALVLARPPFNNPDFQGIKTLLKVMWCVIACSHDKDGGCCEVDLWIDTTDASEVTFQKLSAFDAVQPELVDHEEVYTVMTIFEAHVKAYT